MKDNSKILIALAAGLAAGAVLDILLAPEKGAESRDKLSESLQNLGISIKETAAAAIDRLSGLKNKIAEIVHPREDESIADDVEHA